MDPSHFAQGVITDILKINCSETYSYQLISNYINIKKSYHSIILETLEFRSETPLNIALVTITS